MKLFFFVANTKLLLVDNVKLLVDYIIFFFMYIYPPK
jgi:hypothetical protein